MPRLSASKRPVDRLTLIAAFIGLFSVAIVWRLVHLQIVKHDYYVAEAQRQQVNTQIDEAARGDIFIKANKTGEPTLLAENLTLYLLYVDPNSYMDDEDDSLVDRRYVAEKLAPLLYLHFCGETTIATDSMQSCEEQVADYTNTDASTFEALPIEMREEPMVDAITETTYAKIAEQEVVFVPLRYTNNPKELEDAKTAFAGLSGVVVGDGIIYANPKEVARSGDTLSKDYQIIVDTLNISWEDLESMLRRRISRYSFLVRRVTPELRSLLNDLKEEELRCPQLYKNPDAQEGLSDRNAEMCQHLRENESGRYVKNFHGIALSEENWRNYPEDTIASQIVGFLNFEKQGNYGVEEEFDALLRGVDGKMTLESDATGSLIASHLDPEHIRDKKNGVDVYLTLDRVVQKYVEDRLAQKVKDTKANSGQAIVMDPYTGDIIAMAQYPNFNPNFYQEAYEMRESFIDPGKGRPMFIRNEEGELINIPEDDRSSIARATVKYVYDNLVGPGAFYNYSVQQPYEPGSIFKPLIVAAGIDAGEITPQTLYTDRGELKVDEFTIRNVSEKCLGTHDMINVLNWSCNIGMSFIADKLGRALMYKYITAFGFGERTDIELPNEAEGIVYPYEEWSNARLFNASFGQGLTVTPLQMAQAYSALANGGILVNPRLVESVMYDPGGKDERMVDMPIKRQDRVISKETADTISAMLTQVVEKGGSKGVQMDGYFVAGKTGTAQIASSRGGYEDDPVGSTTGSFAGYLPSDDPRYVIITKIDRPRSTKWADQSAAPLFKEIADFLVTYYNIPPNR